MLFEINVAQSGVYIDTPLNMLAVNLSALPAGVAFVFFSDAGGDGVIQYTGQPGNVRFRDPSPYQPFINAWMTAANAGQVSVVYPNPPVPITLTQAQAIKTGIANAVYYTRRTAPLPYTVAAGAFTWDAGDDSFANLTTASAASPTSIVNAIAPPPQQINYPSSQTITIPAQATSALVEMIGGGGGYYAAGTANGASGGWLQKKLTGLTPGNTLVLTIGAGGGTPGVNGSASTLVSGTQTIGTLTAGGGGGGAVSGAIPGTATGGDINLSASGDFLWQQVGYGAGGTSGAGAAGYCAITWTFGGGAVTTVATPSWTPIGQTTPVSLSTSEFTGLAAAMLAQRTAAKTWQITKQAQIAALSTIAACIAYDATV